MGLVALTGYYFYGRDRARNMSRMQSNANADGGAGGLPSSSEEVNVPAQTKEPMMVFKGGDQGFIPLTLDKAEQINHNTKKLRFKLDEEDSVSGLHIACTPRPIYR